MKYPPLKIWLLTAILLTGIMGVLYSYKKEVSHFFFRKPIEIAFLKASIKPDDVTVILICSSHARAALSHPDKLSKEMLERHGANYSFIKVVKSDAELEDFTGNDYLKEQIIAKNPDYVVLQESHVCFEQPKKKSITIQDFGLKEFHL
ncbi:MAG: hypothetical protein ACI8TA_003456, partial [Cyclobacteriaceae bacterium]